MFRMKLSDYAKEVGVTYKTAYRWWKAGSWTPTNRPTCAIIVHELQTITTGAALNARVIASRSEKRRAAANAAIARLRGSARLSRGHGSDLNRFRPQR
jgi:hypothetical protein